MATAYFRREIKTDGNNWAEPLSIAHFDFTNNRYSINRVPNNIYTLASYYRGSTTTLPNDDNSGVKSFAANVLPRTYRRGFYNGTASSVLTLNHQNIASAGTIIFAGTIPTSPAYAFLIMDGSNEFAFSKFYVRYNDDKLQFVKDSSTVYESSVNEFTVGQRIVIVLTWQSNILSLFFNGVKVYSTTSLLSPPSTFTRTYISSSVYNDQWNGALNNFVLYKQMLSDSICVKLSDRFINLYYSR